MEREKPVAHRFEDSPFSCSISDNRSVSPKKLLINKFKIGNFRLNKQLKNEIGLQSRAKKNSKNILLKFQKPKRKTQKNANLEVEKNKKLMSWNQLKKEIKNKKSNLGKKYSLSKPKSKSSKILEKISILRKELDKLTDPFGAVPQYDFKNYVHCSVESESGAETDSEMADSNIFLDTVCSRSLDSRNMQKNIRNPQLKDAEKLLVNSKRVSESSLTSFLEENRNILCEGTRRFDF